MKFNTYRTAVASLAVVLLVPVTEAAERTSKAQPQDSIDVISNLVLTGQTVSAIQIASYSDRNFIYLKDCSKKSLTVVDVTDAAHPSVARVLAMPETTANETVGVVVGNAAMMIEGAPKPVAEGVKAISIVDFSSAASPKVVRRFLGVTALQVDEERGLIYLVDEGGLQVLKKHPAPDPELERAYTRQVLYNR